MFDKQGGGLASQCKQCRKQHDIDNPIMTQTRYMFKSARARAQNKKIPFDIDKDYIRSIVVSRCPILGMPLDWSCGRENGGKILPNSPSLDRIDPERGYVKGNVWIISFRANMIKSNATHEELKLVTKAVGKALVDSLEF